MKTSRYAGAVPSEAPDEFISGPLWYWAPDQIPAVKSERRRRFKCCIDDVDAPVEFES